MFLWVGILHFNFTITWCFFRKWYPVYNLVLFIYFLLFFIRFLLHTLIIMYIFLHFVVLIICNICFQFALLLVSLHGDQGVTNASFYLCLFYIYMYLFMCSNVDILLSIFTVLAVSYLCNLSKYLALLITFVLLFLFIYLIIYLFIDVYQCIFALSCYKYVWCVFVLYSLLMCNEFFSENWVLSIYKTFLKKLQCSQVLAAW